MDPRSLGAGSLDQSAFQAKFPHIRVRMMKEYIGKFSCSQIMDITTLRCLMEYMYTTIEANKNIWYGVNGLPDRSEMAAQPLHFAFFACLSKLSKAFFVLKKKRRSELHDAETKGKKKQSKGQKRKRSKQEEKESNKLEDEVFAHVQIIDSFYPRFPTNKDFVSSAESVMFDHEVKSGERSSGIMVKAFCKNFLKEKKLDPTNRLTVSYASSIEKLRSIMIVELIDDGWVSGICFSFYFVIKFKIRLYICADFLINL
jgi:hypothetical protein